MTTTEAYESFLIKINQNAITDGIACDKGRFVVIFNDEQNRLIESYIKRPYGDDIRYIQQLLVSYNQVTSSKSFKGHQEFPLPKDFFDLSNVYARAINDVCKTPVKLDLFEIRDPDTNLILSDEFNKPSFKYREAPYILSSGSVKVYNGEEFKITDVILSYFRYPKQIGLIDKENPDGEFNKDNPEFDDKFVNRVITATASTFYLNSDNPKFQIEKQNSIQKI